MDESLFARLATDPDSSIPLQLQYRMCGPINDLANELTYSGSLRCATADVHNSTVHLAPYPATMPAWLRRCLAPDLSNAVLFLDTSLLPESVRNSVLDPTTKSPLNRLEAGLCRLITSGLASCGVSDDQVGVIAPYQSQVKLLRRTLPARSAIEVNTVDQYQGRDKEVIVYSATRSDPPESEPGGRVVLGGQQTILDDFRRLNVAVTRAKCKLVVVGDRSCLAGFGPFARLLEALDDERRRGVYSLRLGVDGFDAGGGVVDGRPSD